MTAIGIGSGSHRLAVIRIDPWVAGHVFLVCLAFATRVQDLAAMPLHSDEAAHAALALRFPWTDDGEVYRYDPTYHGPLQVALISLSMWLFGLGDAAIRVPALLAGTILVALPFAFRPWIGSRAALAASALLCVSPTVTYYSRFGREDVLVGALTVALVAVALAFVDRPRVRTLTLIGLLLALCVATKETTYFTIAIAGSFLLVRVAVERRRRGDGPGELVQVSPVVRRAWPAALVGFAVPYTLLFTTLLAHPAGITGIVDGLTYWAGQQATTTHQAYTPPWFYGLLLVAYETGTLVLGAVGIVVALGRRRLADLYLVWWFVATFVILSVAAERAPWLTLHSLLPLTLLAGIGVGWLADRSGRAAVIAVTIAVALGIRSVVPLVTSPADPRELMAYVQTPDALRAAALEIRSLATEHADLTVELDTTEGVHWPMGWSLSGLEVSAVDLADPGARPTADVVFLHADHVSRLGPELVGYRGRAVAVRSYWIPGGSPARDWVEDYAAGSPDAWLGWLVDRRPWSPIGTDVAWLFVRTELR